MREELNASYVRHGIIAEFGAMVERGEKPPYETYMQFMRGDIDPPIDRAATEQIVRERVQKGELKAGGVDLILTSPALRARQTGEVIRDVLGIHVPIYPTKYLREVRVPMDDITPEFYAQAKGIHAVRARHLQSLLEGKKIDEDIVQVYQRAQRFMTYFRRVRKWTAGHPLFVGHGLFPRFLNLAIQHEGETLSDDEIRNMIQQEFSKTRRFDVLKGVGLFSFSKGTTEGTTIIDLP